MKNLYIAKNDSLATQSQIFDLIVTLDKNVAIKAAEDDIRHLTEREKKNCSVYIEVYKDVVPDDVDESKVAVWYGEILDDCDAEWIGNADEIIEF